MSVLEPMSCLVYLYRSCCVTESWNEVPFCPWWLAAGCVHSKFDRHLAYLPPSDSADETNLYDSAQSSFKSGNSQIWEALCLWYFVFVIIGFLNPSPGFLNEEGKSTWKQLYSTIQETTIREYRSQLSSGGLHCIGLANTIQILSSPATAWYMADRKFCCWSVSHLVALCLLLLAKHSWKSTITIHLLACYLWQLQFAISLQSIKMIVHTAEYYEDTYFVF